MYLADQLVSLQTSPWQAVQPSQPDRAEQLAACQVPRNHQERLLKGKVVLGETGKLNGQRPGTVCLECLTLNVQCSGTKSKRQTSVAVIEAANETCEDQEAALAANAALDVDISQLQVIVIGHHKVKLQQRVCRGQNITNLPCCVMNRIYIYPTRT